MNKACFHHAFIFLLSSLSGVRMARVTLRPASVIQAEGFMVQFRCEIHLHFRDIKWSISDVYLSKYHPVGVIIRSQGHTSVMSITARAEFNGSAIRCVAVDMSFSFEVSNTAYLSVQGSLSSVRNLHISKVTPATVSVSWLPPFSLNLTYVEPDIVYCLNVNRVINQSETHFITNCSIFVTEYVINSNDDSEEMYYVVTVSARNNVESTRNGSEATVLGPIPSEDECTDRIRSGLNYKWLNGGIQANGYQSLYGGLSCYLNISTVEDPQYYAESVCYINCSPVCFVLHGNCSKQLLPNRVYSGQGYCSGSKTLMMSVSLNTHDIQNVAIISKQDELDVEISYLPALTGSVCLGCFMVAMYLNSDTPPMYRVIYRQSYSQSVSIFSVKWNTSGIKLLSFYEIEADQYPGQFPAQTKMLIQNTVPQDNYNCTGKQSSVTEDSSSKQLCTTHCGTAELCLTIYHKCWDGEVVTLSSFHHNSQSIHGNTRSSATCVQIVPGCYWVTVFGLDATGRMMEHPLSIEMNHVEGKVSQCSIGSNDGVTAHAFHNETNVTSTVVIVTITVVGLVVVIVCITSLVVCVCRCRSKRCQEENFQMDICEAYETVNIKRPQELYTQVYYRRLI